MLISLFEQFPNLPNVPYLLETAALTLSAYSSWLAKTLAAGKLQSLVPQLLQLLSKGPHFLFVQQQLAGPRLKAEKARQAWLKQTRREFKLLLESPSAC